MVEEPPDKRSIQVQLLCGLSIFSLYSDINGHDYRLVKTVGVIVDNPLGLAF